MIDANDLKQIPYGVADFNDFRVKNLYYVDKTRYIRDIEKKGNFLFLIRPRRFGKSLFLGIMEAYYDIDFKDRFDYFFKGTAIHRNPTAEKNSYLVFKLNFSLVNPNVSLVEGSFLNYIQESASWFVMKYGKLLDIDIKKAETEFSSRKSASDVMVTLLKYCKRKKQKLYVIIDEYDNFANTILSEVGEQEFQKITHGGGFLRAFFNVLKGGTTDTDAPISRLFMTGVSPITLDDVTSGFNIATNISLHSDINEIMGFTQPEVETMIEYYRQTGKIHHSTPVLLEMMSRWYNHYRFSLYSGREVFNTAHVLYFLKEYMIDSRIPGTLIDHNARIDYMKLRHLIVVDQKGAVRANGNFSILREIMETGSAHSIIAAGFPIDELANPNNFISLLYYFGLLTIGGIDDENTPVLTIPNESVKRLYYDYISETYRETGVVSLDMFKYGELVRGMAYRGKWQELVEYIAGRMEASLSLRDLMSGEKALQVFWNVYLGLGPLYNVYSEKEMSQGFCDLVLEPLSIQYPTIKYSYLIELKYIKPTGNKPGNPRLIKKLKEEAESQLDRYSPDEKFQKAISRTTLKKLVLIFCGSRLVYKGESEARTS
ncbi:MAG: AAA family ATPase [Candidatus Aminicenantes bacterium]|nr:MAG: AAA family ATPase [Candidatus Aminicenantes bacterium]